MPTPFPIQGLIELAERHPLEQKWLIVPTFQDGAAMTIAAARKGAGLLDLTPLTLQQLADRLGKPRLAANGKRPLPAGYDRLLIEQVFDTDDEALLPLDPHNTRRENPAIGDALCRSINTLRLAGTDSNHALQAARGERARSVAAALAAFENLLHAGSFVDDADLYRAAIQHASETHAIVAVLDEVQLDALPARLLEQLREHAPAFYRIGLRCTRANSNVVDDATGLTVPYGTVAYRFADVPRLPAEPIAHALGGIYTDQASGLGGLHLMTAATPSDELRGVLHRIGKNGIPLEEVEIAYIHRDPYLALFAGIQKEEETEAEPVGLALPLTMASGRPLVSTGPGAFLKGLLGWIAEDFPPDRLLRLVRGSLLRLDRLGGIDTEAATEGLARIYFGRGIAGHRRSIEALDATRPLRASLEALFGLLPESSVLPHEFAASVRALLTQFGPVDAQRLHLKQARLSPKEGPFTDDEFAYLQLSRHLDALSISPVGFALPSSRAAMLLGNALLSGFGRAEAPQPGHLHVVPLANAGFSGRPHLFVVGLDGNALSANPTAEAFVPSEADGAGDHAAFGGEALPSGHPADFNLWLAVRALARASGSVALSHPFVDPVSDDPIEPSPLYLRAQWRLSRATDATPQPFRIGDDAGRLSAHGAIDGAEYAVALGRAAAEPNPDAAALHALSARFPGAVRGLQASQRKDVMQLTEYDGWIGGTDGASPSDLETLNLFGNDAPSATRLQMLATCPHKYFLRYVLGLKASDEPPDEDDWLDALQRGEVLHAVFRRFMESLPYGRKPSTDDAALLGNVFEEVLAVREAEYPPPDSAIGRTTRNRLWEATQIFFQTEVAQQGYEPVAFELGFGIEQEKKQQHPEGHPEDHTGPLVLNLPGLPPVRLKGIVDRVDKVIGGSHPDRYAVWDYKTGSSKKFVDKSDSLDDGRLIQLHLYAHALRAAFGWDVEKTGYAFPTVKENGYREEFPVASEERLAQVIGDLAVLPPAGFFVQAPSSDNCTYCDYKEACGPYATRKKIIDEAAKAALEDADHPASNALTNWNYL